MRKAQGKPPRNGKSPHTKPELPEDNGPDLAEPGTPAHRTQIVGAFMTVMGMKREAAEAQYEQQLAQWQMSQAGK